MTVLDDYEGNHIRCDKCHAEFYWSDNEAECNEYFALHSYWMYDLFHRRSKSWIPDGDFCLKCAKQLNPFIHALRDIYELVFYANKLGRATNERKKHQDNGAAPRAAG